MVMLVLMAVLATLCMDVLIQVLLLLMMWMMVGRLMVTSACSMHDITTT